MEAIPAPPAAPATSKPGWIQVVACVALLLAGAVAHFWDLTADCSLDLAGDEAHYWEWSRHLDLSYYSKGPLVAYIIAAGRFFLADWSRQLVGSEMLAVRVPAILLSVLTGLGIFTLGLDALRNPRLALVAVALTFTMPVLAAGAMLMTIDAPLMCAWTWTLVCVARGVRRDRLITWLAAGLLIALGILAKYTMVLVFPVVGLWLLREHRFLRRPGPYLAAAVGLLGFVPIIVWNARHDWVSFRHVAGQAGVAGGLSFDPAGIAAYLGGQAAVINALWFIGMLWAAASVMRTPCPAAYEAHDVSAVRLLVVAMLAPWVTFLLFSPITKIQPNWPVVALVSGTILLSLWLRRRLRLPTTGGRNGARAFIAAGVAFGGALVLVGHHTEWLTPLFAWCTRGAPSWELTPIAKLDPTARLRGWAELGAAVGDVLSQERAAGHDPFILTDDYQIASEIAFYCPGSPTVYCVQAAFGGRLSQYDLWPNPLRDRERFLGRPCLYIGRLHPGLTGENGAASAALPGLRQARIVEHRVRGEPLNIWTIYVCDAFAGFPTPDPSGQYRF